jgi:tetratricopeptide (TPR) repeat protein
LRLDVLQPKNTGKMLEALLGIDSSLASLKKLLLKRGNPFFLEETVRSLLETKMLVGERGRYRLSQPIQKLQAPPTIHLMLAGRIDRLAPADKCLLQVASVIGKDVSFSLLQAIAGLSEQALCFGLERLQSAEFLHETGQLPDAGYAFKHALSHEVVYGGLLQEDRRELHSRTVDAIEARHWGRLAEQIERLAYHAVRGELREKAVHYLQQAGLKTAARSAPKEARVWFEQALTILETLPEVRSALERAFQIRLELHHLIAVLGETWAAREHLRAAEIIADRMNDDTCRGHVLARMTLIHAQLGELHESLESGLRALELDRRLGGHSSFRNTAKSHMIYTHYLRGEYERGVELSRLADHRHRREGGAAGWLPLPADWKSRDYITPDLVYDRVWLVMNLVELGRFSEAARFEAEMMRIVGSIQHAHSVGMAYFAASAIHLGKGDWKAAISLIEQAIAVFRTGNIIVQLRNMTASSAWVLAQLGRESEALNKLRESQELLEYLAAKGYGSNTGRAYYSLGRACLLLRRFDEAQNWGECVNETSPLQLGFRAHALQLLGDLANQPDCFNAESAYTYYLQALKLAQSRGMRPVVAHCHLGLGKLYHRTDRREHLTTATTMYRDMGMTYWLEKAEAEMVHIG